MDHFQIAGDRCRQVWKRVVYHWDFRIRVQIWWKNNVLWCSWPLPHIPVSSYSNIHPEWTTSRSPVVDVDKFEKKVRYYADFQIWVQNMGQPGQPWREAKWALGQRLAASTVGGIWIRDVVQMNRLGWCYRMVMIFFFWNPVVAQTLRYSKKLCGWRPLDPFKVFWTTSHPELGSKRKPT